MRGIITLCGSVKFKKRFEEVNQSLERAGWIVLSVADFNHESFHTFEKDIKEKLDILHKVKINISEAIFVIDVNTYVGESTKSEIDYAKQKDKQIYWFSKGDLERINGNHD